MKAMRKSKSQLDEVEGLLGFGGVKAPVITLERGARIFARTKKILKTPRNTKKVAELSLMKGDIIECGFSQSKLKAYGTIVFEVVGPPRQYADGYLIPVCRGSAVSKVLQTFCENA